jgi:CRP-like cAMP-binding protein
MYARFYTDLKDIVRKDKTFHEMYFIQHGSVVIRQGKGKQESFCELGKGSIFGEYNLLTGKKSDFHYTAVAQGSSTELDHDTLV